MTAARVVGAAFLTVLVAICFTVGYRALDPAVGSTVARVPGTMPPAVVAEADHQSFLFGRVTAVDGVTYEGRLRWGGDQEAFWGNYFNGARKTNSWASQVPSERLPREFRPIQVFGMEIARRERPANLGRLFMMRFGDIATIEARGRDVRVTIKSGAVFDLDRYSASDFDDGVRVWDTSRGIADLDSLRIRKIELFSAPQLGVAPERLYGTVCTSHGDFTGFIQWDREQCLGSDELHASTEGGERGLRFDTIQSIARRSRDSLVVMLRNGREAVLSGKGQGGRGIYVDDPRYGRVLVSWQAFERIDFSPGGAGPAYGDFPRGGPLKGTVVTRTGRSLTGRLVYDLDESEITETLDAPFQGVNYTIPFGLIASIVLSNPEDHATRNATVILHSGEQLQLNEAGDLGNENAGILIFIDGQRHEYVPWADVGRLSLNRPAAMYPYGGACSGAESRVNAPAAVATAESGHRCRAFLPSTRHTRQRDVRISVRRRAQGQRLTTLLRAKRIGPSFVEGP